MVGGMKAERLAQLIERPEVQRLVTADRVERFSIGVRAATADPDAASIVVRVPDEEAAVHVPESVELDGETIAIATRLGYRTPKPLG